MIAGRKPTETSRNSNFWHICSASFISDIRRDSARIMLVFHCLPWHCAHCSAPLACALWQRNIGDVTQRNELSCRFKNFALILRLSAASSVDLRITGHATMSFARGIHAGRTTRAINWTTHDTTQLHYDVICLLRTLRECTQKGRDLKSPTSAAKAAERRGSLWCRHRTVASTRDRTHARTHKDVGSALSRTRWRNPQLPANTDMCQLRDRRNNRYDRDTRSGELTTWTDATRRGISRVLLVEHWWTGSCVAELSCTAWWRASSL